MYICICMYVSRSTCVKVVVVFLRFVNPKVATTSAKYNHTLYVEIVLG